MYRIKTERQKWNEMKKKQHKTLFVNNLFVVEFFLFLRCWSSSSSLELSFWMSSEIFFHWFSFIQFNIDSANRFFSSFLLLINFKFFFSFKFTLSLYWFLLWMSWIELLMRYIFFSSLTRLINLPECLFHFINQIRSIKLIFFILIKK